MTISHLARLHILDVCPLVDIFIALAKFAVILGANRGLVILAFVSSDDNINIPYNCHFFYTDTIFGE